MKLIRNNDGEDDNNETGVGETDAVTEAVTDATTEAVTDAAIHDHAVQVQSEIRTQRVLWMCYAHSTSADTASY